MLHIILLYCTVLYCTLLYCTVLYCTVLYGLWCTALYVPLSISIPSSAYLTPFLSCLLFCYLLSLGCLLGSISPTQMSCGDHSLYCPSGSSKSLHVGAGFYTVVRKHHRYFLRITVFHFHPSFISQRVNTCKP